MSDQQWTPGDDDTSSGGGAPPPPPPPPPHGGPPAGGPGGATTSAGPDLGKRFLARLIDWVILWVVYLVLGLIVFAAAMTDAASGGMMGGGLSVGQIILGLIPGAYFIGMLAYNNGKTLGKAILGLQVRTTDGGPLDIGQAFRREWWNLLVVIPFIGGLAAAGMAIFIAVTINNNQPWHDQQANTTEVLTK